MSAESIIVIMHPGYGMGDLARIARHRKLTTFIDLDLSPQDYILPPAGSLAFTASPGRAGVASGRSRVVLDLDKPSYTIYQAAVVDIANELTRIDDEDAEPMLRLMEAYRPVSGRYEVHRMSRGIQAAVEVCHGLASRAGWWDDLPSDEKMCKNVFGTKIALIHSEVSEMLEGLRKGKSDDHLPNRSAEEVEAADIAIRLFDYCGARGIDLAGAVIEKLLYNQQRADHKPEARAAEGGKAF